MSRQLAVHHYPSGSTVRANRSVINRSRLTVHGNGNRIEASYSTIHGDGNFIDGSNVTVFGNGNSITSNYSKLWGQGNAIDGRSAKVTGNNNQVNGNYSNVEAHHNVVSGSSVRVTGSNNRVTGKYSRVGGDHNVVGGRSATVTGNDNNVSGSYSSADGQRNTVNGMDAEVSREQERQRLQQTIQRMQNNRNADPHVQALLETFSFNLPGQTTQPAQQQNGGRARADHQPQPIQLQLRGQDEPLDRNNENDDSCRICLTNKAVVASHCCGKLITCLHCARDFYGGKVVGERKCLNCPMDVTNVLRISSCLAMLSLGEDWGGA